MGVATLCVRLQLGDISTVAAQVPFPGFAKVTGRLIGYESASSLPYWSDLLYIIGQQGSWVQRASYPTNCFAELEISHLYLSTHTILLKSIFGHVRVNRAVAPRILGRAMKCLPSRLDFFILFFQDEALGLLAY